MTAKESQRKVGEVALRLFTQGVKFALNELVISQNEFSQLSTFLYVWGCSSINLASHKMYTHCNSILTLHLITVVTVQSG